MKKKMAIGKPKETRVSQAEDLKDKEDVLSGALAGLRRRAGKRLAESKELRDEANELVKKLVKVTIALGDVLCDARAEAIESGRKGGRGKRVPAIGDPFGSEALAKSIALSKGTARRHMLLARWHAEHKKDLWHLFNSQAAKDVVYISRLFTAAEAFYRVTKDGTVSLPKGVFDVFIYDPPWPYRQIWDADEKDYHPEGRRAANPYPEMSIEQITAVIDLLQIHEDAVLWLWTTHRFMRSVFEILDAKGWGFQEVSILTWVKDRIGLGRWLRSKSEFCVLAVRGDPNFKNTSASTVLEAPMREHSRKPDEFYELVKKCSPGSRILDFPAREKRDGIEVAGNEVDKFLG